MKLLLTILAFNLMIIIHELGHFLVAKFFNVYVKEFSLFVGPKIFSKKIGETIYSLRTIPIAAYVKMEGEEELSDSERSYNAKPIWQRALIIFAGPFANIVSAIIAIAIAFSISGTDTLKVSKIDRGSPADLAGVKVGDILTEYAGKSTYTPIDFLTYTNVNPGVPATMVVEREGKEIPLNIQPLREYKRYLLGMTFQSTLGLRIDTLTPGYPAALAGIQPGDIIQSVDGIILKNYDALVDAITSKKGEAVSLVVMREGKELPPMVIQPKEETLNKVVYVGLLFSKEDLGFLETLKHAGWFAWSNTKNVAYTLKWLITREVQLNQLMGPVGIVAAMNSAVSSGIDYQQVFLNLLGTFALISVAIGATNLVPFPALDGSKLLLLLIEAIRRKPIPVEKEAAISFVGLVLLMCLAIFVTYADINRLMNGFFKP